MYDRQSFEIDGKRRFWGGLVLGTIDGGKGLIEQHTRAAKQSGIEIRYDSPVVGLIQDENGTATSVVCETAGGRKEDWAGAVILAAGHFEPTRKCGLSTSESSDGRRRFAARRTTPGMDSAWRSGPAARYQREYQPAAQTVVLDQPDRTLG